ARVLRRRPAKSTRGPDQIATAAAIHTYERIIRERYLAAHAATVYDPLTNRRRAFVRAGELVRAAAKLVPGLVPSAKDLAAEALLMLAEKEGHEIDQGLFLSHVLANPDSGRH